MVSLSGNFHFEYDSRAVDTIRVSCWPVEHPGCIATGATHAEAFNKLAEVLPGYLASLAMAGGGVTTHDSAVNSTAVYDFDGK